MRRARTRPRRAGASPIPSAAKLGGQGRRGRRCEFVEPPAHPIAFPAAGSGEALSDNVGAGIVQRSSRQPRQDRRFAAARASHRSFGGAQGLWRSGAQRRRGVARSVPSARQRSGRQCGGARSRRPAGGRRPQRRTGFHVHLDCASGRVGDRLRRSARRGAVGCGRPAPPKLKARDRRRRRRRIRRLPTPPRRVSRPHPTCSPT